MPGAIAFNNCGDGPMPKGNNKQTKTKNSIGLSAS